MNTDEMQQIMQTDIGWDSNERGLMRFFQFRLTLSRWSLNNLLPVLCYGGIEREFFRRLVQLQQLILAQSDERHRSLGSRTEFDIVLRCCNVPCNHDANIPTP
jgi:hypothetical protein